MGPSGGIIRIPLLGLALLSATGDSRSFRRTSVAGGGDSLASGTGPLLGFGSVDFGRAGLAGAELLSGGVDGGGEFEEAIEKVSGKRGKSGKLAESAFFLAKDGSEEVLLERGSFSLDDGRLKSRRLKDLVYKDTEKGAAAAKESFHTEGGERVRSSDSSGFSNSYQLNEKGQKSSFSDKFRHAAKFKDAEGEKVASSSDGGSRKYEENVERALHKEAAKKDGAYLKAAERKREEQRQAKARLKKFLSEERKRRTKKGDDEDYYYDEDDYGDEDESEVKSPRQYILAN